MKKLDRDKEGASLDILADNIERLRAMFPEAFVEGSDDDGPRWKVDFDVLKQLLGAHVEPEQERYSFTWNGKSRARRIAQTPSMGTLRPRPEESVSWETTQNIFIEGDNLEVLKLLQKSYHRRVKMIYIDPPYNTGNEFIYPDRFADNLQTYLRYTGQVDGEGLKLSANAETAGRYHTNWLNMMYPRLRLARNLLREDGVLFVSIDDHEVHNLRHLLDELFGPENFIAQIIWQHSVQPKGYKGIHSVHHNYILSYRRSEAHEVQLLERTERDNKSYSNPDNDPRGRWRTGDVRNSRDRPNLKYEIQTPSGKTIEPPENGWRWSRETLESKMESGEIVFSADETRIIRKIYLADQEGRTPETIWFAKDAGATRDGARQLKDLFDGRVPFDTVKPLELVERMMQVAGVTGNDIVLDFFAGSGSTGHAILERGQGRFVLVQLPELVDDSLPHGKTARKLNLATVSEIALERLRRASAIQRRQSTENHDVGFKVFELASSNIRPWNAAMETLEAESLWETVDNLEPGRKKADLLHELLLKFGLDLATPVERREFDGKVVEVIGGGVLLVCLEDEIELSVVKAIAGLAEEMQPEVTRVVFRDAGFADDVVKTNAVQILTQAGVDEVRSL